jgi:hypothetical protein
MAVLAVPRYEEVVGPIENKILFSRVLWFKSFFNYSINIGYVCTVYFTASLKNK